MYLVLILVSTFLVYYHWNFFLVESPFNPPFVWCSIPCLAFKLLEPYIMIRTRHMTKFCYITKLVWTKKKTPKLWNTVPIIYLKFLGTFFWPLSRSAHFSVPSRRSLLNYFKNTGWYRFSTFRRYTFILKLKYWNIFCDLTWFNLLSRNNFYKRKSFLTLY